MPTKCITVPTVGEGITATLHSNLTVGTPFHPPVPTATFTRDAPLWGWETHLRGLVCRSTVAHHVSKCPYTFFGTDDNHLSLEIFPSFGQEIGGACSNRQFHSPLLHKQTRRDGLPEVVTHHFNSGNGVSFTNACPGHPKCTGRPNQSGEHSSTQMITQLE